MSNYRKKPSPKIKEIDEVEELLRATEDSMVLKLSVNSHLSSSSSSSSSSHLDQDLLSRFEALKKPSVPKKTTKVPSKSSELKKDDGEIVSDPFARFSALKGGGGGGNSSSIKIPGSCGGGSDVSEEDEVEKLMQWAMDAARLDPSVTDEEDDDECVSSEDDLDTDDDNDTEEEEEDKKKKKKKSENTKKKKNEKKTKSSAKGSK